MIRRCVVAVVAVVGGLVASLPGAGAQDLGTEAQRRQLAERYVPVVMLKAQEEECDRSGEGFQPDAVETVLGNPEVLLRQAGNFDPVVIAGPEASDLFQLGAGWYLDFPGDALAPGCVFEQDARRFAAGRPSTVYAHVATEEGEPGTVALQYWFWWYYNDWNNLHEGDWEFIQLLFDADTVSEALETEPSAVGYSQHSGGERAAWSDDKLEREGSRPVVYPSAGSHATYFGPQLYLGRSASEGFGCDDSTGPSRRVDPEVVVLPDAVDSAGDPLAWLTFEGRWGQREDGSFNGPTGPADKSQWTEPVSWHDGLRDRSVRIPDGGDGDSAILTVFCTTVETGSGYYQSALRSPGPALIALGVLAGAGVVLARSTTWRSPVGLEVRRRRRAGQILDAARRVYGRHPALLVSLGLLYVPVAVVMAGVEAVLQQVPVLRDLLALGGSRSEIGVLLSLVVGGIGNLIAFAVVSAAVAVALSRLGEGGSVTAVDAYRAALARSGHLLVTLGLAFVIVLGLSVSIVGLPWAVRQLIRYQLVPQVVVLEGQATQAALRRSSDLVKGTWWSTAALVVVIQWFVGAAGVVLGLLLLVLAAGLPLWSFQVITSAVYFLIVPAAAAAMAYLYGDRATRMDEAEGADPGPIEPDRQPEPAR